MIETRPLAPDERVVLLHIPKCAGTTLFHLVAKHFPDDAICPQRADLLPSMPLGEVMRYRLFSGHFSKYGVDRVPGPKRVVTILREPRDRLLSLYYFWKAHPENLVTAHGLVGPRAARSASLLEFLLKAEGPVRGNLDNFMTRALLGPVTFGPQSGFRFREPEVCVEAALTTLRRFTYVGFFEHLAGEWPAILASLGLPFDADIPQLNARGSRVEAGHLERVEEEPITPDISAALDRLTALDRLLYARALEERGRLANPLPL